MAQNTRSNPTPVHPVNVFSGTWLALENVFGPLWGRQVKRGIQSVREIASPSAPLTTGRLAEACGLNVKQVGGLVEAKALSLSYAHPRGMRRPSQAGGDLHGRAREYRNKSGRSRSGGSQRSKGSSSGGSPAGGHHAKSPASQSQGAGGHHAKTPASKPQGAGGFRRSNERTPRFHQASYDEVESKFYHHRGQGNNSYIKSPTFKPTGTKAVRREEDMDTQERQSPPETFVTPSAPDIYTETTASASMKPSVAMPIRKVPSNLDMVFATDDEDGPAPLLSNPEVGSETEQLLGDHIEDSVKVIDNIEKSSEVNVEETHDLYNVMNVNVANDNHHALFSSFAGTDDPTSRPSGPELSVDAGVGAGSVGMIAPDLHPSGPRHNTVSEGELVMEQHAQIVQLQGGLERLTIQLNACKTNLVTVTKEKNQLSLKNEEAQSEVLRLTSVVNAREREIESQKQICENYKQDIAMRDSQIESHTGTVDRLHNTVNQYKSALQTAQNRKVELKEMIVGLREEVQTTHDLISAGNTERQDLKDQILSLERRNANLQEATKLQSDEIVALKATSLGAEQSKSELAKFTKKAQELSTRLDILRSEVEKKDKLITDLNEKLNLAQTKLNESEKKYNKNKKELSDSKVLLNERNKQIGEKEKEFAELKSRLNERKTGSDEKDNELSSLRDKLRDREKFCKDMEEELSDYRQQLSEIESRYKEKDNELSEIKDKVTNMEKKHNSELVEINKELSDKDKDMQDVRAQWKEKEKKCEETIAKVDETLVGKERELNNVKAQLAEIKRKVRESPEDKTLEIKEAQQKLGASEKECKELTKKLNALEKNYTAKCSLANDTQKSLDKANSRIEKLLADKESLVSKEKKMKEQLGELAQANRSNQRAVKTYARNYKEQLEVNNSLQEQLGSGAEAELPRGILKLPDTEQGAREHSLQFRESPNKPTQLRAPRPSGNSVAAESTNSMGVSLPKALIFKCETCDYMNTPEVEACVQCGELNPLLYMFGPGGVLACTVPEGGYEDPPTEYEPYEERRSRRDTGRNRDRFFSGYQHGWQERTTPGDHQPPPPFSQPPLSYTGFTGPRSQYSRGSRTHSERTYGGPSSYANYARDPRAMSASYDPRDRSSRQSYDPKYDPKWDAQYFPKLDTHYDSKSDDRHVSRRRTPPRSRSRSWSNSRRRSRSGDRHRSDTHRRRRSRDRSRSRSGSRSRNGHRSHRRRSSRSRSRSPSRRGRSPNMPKMCHFSGTAYDGEEWEPFILQFEHMAEKQRWSSSVKLDKFIECLRGQALTYARRLGSRDNYDRLRDRMAERFDARDSTAVSRRQLACVAQKEDQTIEEFHQQVHFLVLQAYPTADRGTVDDLATEHFLRGLIDKEAAKSAGMRCPQDYYEARDFVKAYMATQVSLNLPGPPRRSVRQAGLQNLEDLGEQLDVRQTCPEPPPPQAVRESLQYIELEQECLQLKKELRGANQQLASLESQLARSRSPGGGQVDPRRDPGNAPRNFTRQSNVSQGGMQGRNSSQVQDGRDPTFRNRQSGNTSRNNSPGPVGGGTGMRNRSQSPASRPCYHCGEVGHFKRECPLLQSPPN